ncbi:hypothetical protein [Priestia koreensis]|uniref:hypothetical protein n=1 Tax=Priestia koreensis TaxID=284581 RepID=UPI001F5798E2|nr:hypothetical protein [Priestia koreensis]MCM3003072.1 hypothetical protein [Priestia koreensis]UNL85884.1 hypothetical protein IE339_05080 [Priestia koreensis]
MLKAILLFAVTGYVGYRITKKLLQSNHRKEAYFLLLFILGGDLLWVCIVLEVELRSPLPWLTMIIQPIEHWFFLLIPKKG